MFDDKKYIGKDMPAIKNEIIEFIKQKNPDWTDFNMSSIQEQYTNILAGVADMLCYYLDNQALETFLATARQEKNIRSIMSTMNYHVETIGPAKGEVLVERKIHEMNTEGEEPVYVQGRFFIPKYTAVVSSSESVPTYLTIEDALMENNDKSITIPVIQGKLHTMDIPVSVVKQSFKLYLTERPIPLAYVEIGNEGWEKVDDAFTQVDGGKKYSVHVDSKGGVYILFTFDWKRYLPSDESEKIVVRYVETLGSTGVIDPYVLGRFKDKIVDITTGEDAGGKVYVYNKNKTYGAFDSINLNRQKANARNYLKTYDRIILLDDLEVMVKKEGWVKDCICFDWRKDDTIVQYPHMMKAWVVTVDGPSVVGNQLSELTKSLQGLTVTMTNVEVLSAEFEDLELKVGVCVVGANATLKEKVRKEIEDKLKTWYLMDSYLENDENSRLKFGMELDPRYLEIEINQMFSSVEGVIVHIPDTIKLRPVQFFNISKIEVYTY